MIGALSGTLLQRSGENLIIDVHGVGYIVTASAQVLNGPLSQGGPVSVIVHTDVKENAITLYAFNDQLERRVFLLLKKVKGIGSRLALNILSGIGAEALLTAIGQQNVAGLQKVPGIGRKSAERLIVELREYVGELAYAEDEAGEGAPALRKTGFSDAVSDSILALEKLGFAPERAKAAVQAAADEYRKQQPSAALDAGEILRLSLTKL